MVADPEYLRLYRKDWAHIQVTITSTDDETAMKYENASPISERIKAIETLQKLGFDISVRLSPFIPNYVDYAVLNGIQCDKILVEFLRCNGFIRKMFPLDYTEYTAKQNGYWHLPLEKKKEDLKPITGFREITICEDESEAYEYWKNHFNPNRDDCCNLRRT